MESFEKIKKIEAAKTALDLSPFEWKRYHPFGTGGRHSSLLLTSGQDSARNVAGSIAQELVKRFGANRVVLFGSAARSEMRKMSDIDLAVWGIPPKDFYRAVAFASGYSKEWKVDLVDAEDCRETLFRSILKEGVDL
jgi:predicted nucleotidyltransferase